MHSTPIRKNRTLHGLLLVLVTMLMWSIGPLFIKHFTHSYNVWTQNAFRYFSAAVILLLFTGLRGGLRYSLSKNQWKRLALVAFVNVVMQSVFASAYYFIYPAVASLVARTNILFIVLLSFFLFHDERRVIRSPRFLLGAALALIGVVLVILRRDPQMLLHLNVSEGDFWLGAAFAVGFAFFNAVYSLTIKHAVKDIPPVLCFTHVAWMTALALSLPMFLSGGHTDLYTQPPIGLFLMALSALLAIVIAHSCYYAALRDITAVVSSSMQQLTPLFTCLFSALLYGDLLTPVQCLGGAAIIIGACLAAITQARLNPTP